MGKAILSVREEELSGSLKKRLKEQGIAEIIACDSAAELFAEAAESGPVVAVLELSPQDKDVCAAAKKLSDRLGIAILLITEGCSADKVKKWGEAGVSAVLTKPVREEELVAALGVSLAALKRSEALRAEIAALKETIESRKVVEKAKGRLMERDHLTEAEAFRRMQRLAMDRRISMRQLAEAILLTDRIGC